MRNSVEPGQGTNGEPHQQRAAAVNTASYKRVDKGEPGLVSKRTGNHPKLAQLMVALPCNQIYMMRESELRIKHDTVVVHTSREGYVREERGEPENQSLQVA